MEEEYELTTEQKKDIKNLFTIAKAAKRRAKHCYNGYALIDILKHEKEEKMPDMNIKSTLKSHVDLYKDVLDKLDIVSNHPLTENTRRGKLAEMYKPFVKKYKDLAEQAVDIYNKEFEPQNEEYKMTGQITSKHLTRDPEDIKKRREELHDEERIKAARDWQAKFMGDLKEMQKKHNQRNRMKTYKLTPEEKETVKKMNLIIKKSKDLEKNQEQPNHYPIYTNKYDAAFTNMFKEQGMTEKLEEKGSIKAYIKIYYKLGKSLKEELELCKKIQDQDILSVISKEPEKFKVKGIEEKFRKYHEKKLKPAVEKYTLFLEEITKVYNDYAKKLFDSIKYNTKKFLIDYKKELIENKIVDGNPLIIGMINSSNKDLMTLYDNAQPEFKVVMDDYGGIVFIKKCEKIPVIKKGIVNCSYEKSEELFKHVKPKFIYDYATGKRI